MARTPLLREFKWLVCAAFVYVALCAAMLLWQPQLNIEPVAEKRDLLSYDYPEGRGSRRGLSHMTTLVKSHMFSEQGIKLKWISERMKRMTSSWEKAQHDVAMAMGYLFTNPKNILLFPGLLSEYSAYDFANKAFKGGYLGELVQWSDLISALHMLGHHVVVMTTRQQLSNRVRLDEPTYDLLFTDYIGLFALRDSQHFALYKCRIRVLDSFGTEPIFNFRTRDYQEDETMGMFNNWNFEDMRQFWTLFPHTPDNSFLGFVVEAVAMGNDTAKKNQGVIYGKEGYYTTGRESYLKTIGEIVQLHSTFNSEEVPSYIENHGILPQQDLFKLLRESKVFVGLGFPYDGPGPFEALASGCAFIQPRFDPPHSSRNSAFFAGKPTSRELSSQVPYLERFVGEPYVYTVDATDDRAVRDAVYSIISQQNRQPFIPHEFTQQGMLERVGMYITHQNFCDGEDLAVGRPTSSSSRYEDHTPGEAVDGILTEDTCFWSAPDDSHWWLLDLGADLNIAKIRITNTFEWILAKKWGVVFMNPFVVTLSDSFGNQVASHSFTDARTFYLWEGINNRARFVRIDSLDFPDPTYFVICAVEVFGGSSQHPVWPDLTLLRTVTSDPGQSCKDACLSAGDLLCEAAFFKAVNQQRLLEEEFRCKQHNTTAETDYVDFPPALAVDDDRPRDVTAGTCITNGNSMLLSCTGKHERYRRLCPCRRFTPGQMAIPPGVQTTHHKAGTK